MGRVTVLALLAVALASCAHAVKYFHGNKIDDTGKYQPHPGINLICFTPRERDGKWGQVHKYVTTNEAILAYYSPLPLESYHMTIHPLFTQRMVGAGSVGELERVILSMRPGFEAVQFRLEQEPLAPVVRVEGVSAGRMILGIGFAIASKDQGKAVASLRADAASKIGLPAPSTDYGFHMTLGYRYRDLPGAWSAERAKLNAAVAELERIVREAVCDEQAGGVGGLCTFAPAVLTTFADMTKFVPTDPRQWPRSSVPNLVYAEEKREL
eukprot:m51a1_g2889 hypothetical protein (268) ;mRNA; r:422508-423519